LAVLAVGALAVLFLLAFFVLMFDSNLVGNRCPGGVVAPVWLTWSAIPGPSASRKA
jgi:hypothetical protein